MKKYFFIILLSITNIYSQIDLKAEELLKRVSFNIDNAKNYSINFSYQLDDNINQLTKGSVIISKDNYFLDFMGIKQICDSSFIYTIVPENEEVMISEISEEDSQTISPSKILNFYRQGYIIELDESKNENNFKIQYIKLTPIDSNSDVSHLYLGINSNYNIYKVIEIGKNKSKTIFKVNKILYNIDLEKDIFTFDKNKYEGYYIERI
ncbi:outer membrane lipoprotein carrier protein LolA [Flavobacteriaceae bacterium]|jgi:outer membrane lipoprotein-sorting protein|nr:outer membrane lipoprotein carrier protein LolA [Flavobacteriaceae bacterium]|tara:strand:- start:3494 stop:4117 length:624 start_codon:yes stop_codon:yes gene_type:complete